MNKNNYLIILDNLIIGILTFLGIFGILPHYLILNNLKLSLLTPLIIVSLCLLIVYIFKRVVIYKNWGVITCGVLFLYLLMRSFFLPVSGWDTYSLYDSRAKIFYQGGNYQTLFELSRYDIYNGLYYFSYPPMTSYLHLLAYQIGLNTPMPVYSLFYIAYASVLLYWISKSQLQTPLKWLISIVSVFHPAIFPHINAGYTNLPMLSFQLGAIHVMLKNINDPKFRYLFFFSIFIAFSVWTRITEPTYIAFWIAWWFTLSKLTNLKHKIFYFILPIIVTLLIRNYWVNFSNFYIRQVVQSSTLDIRFSEKIYDALMIGNLLNITQHLIYSLKSIIAIITIPIILLILRIINKRYNILRNPLFILWLVIFAIEFMGIVYVSAYYDWWNKIPDSLLRTSLILIPLASIDYAKYHENS